MRVIVFFDLPTLTDEDKRNYRKFRKYLIETGFMMLQESVYAKLALNQTCVMQIVKEVKNKRPGSGLVQILTVTEKQFAKIEMINADCKNKVVCSDERLLVL